MLGGAIGGRWPYLGSTAEGQQAKSVYLLGPSTAADWGCHAAITSLSC